MMSLQALCWIKLLIIFSIFECYVCYQATFHSVSPIIDSYKMINLLSSVQEPSTFIAVISKCNIYDEVQQFFFKTRSNVTYFKVLAADNTTSRLIEIFAKHTEADGKTEKKDQFEIQSRDDFDVNTCSHITTRNADCLIDYSACERKLGTTYRGTGLYTKTDHCVELLKKLRYVKIDYENLKLIKRTQTEGICPLTHIEILLLAPNMNHRNDYRTLSTLQVHSVFPLLKMEIIANHTNVHRFQLTDGPHRFSNNNTVLDFYANMFTKGRGESNYRIERVFNVDGKPTISLRDPVRVTPSDAIRDNYT